VDNRRDTNKTRRNSPQTKCANNAFHPPPTAPARRLPTPSSIPRQDFFAFFRRREPFFPLAVPAAHRLGRADCWEAPCSPQAFGQAQLGGNELVLEIAELPRQREQLIKRWDPISRLVGCGAPSPTPLDKFAVQSHGRRFQRALICSRFIDSAGNHLEGPLDDRMIGLVPDRMRGLAVGILVSCGVEKVAGIRATLLGGYATHLFTDVPTAAGILAMDDSR
jgi:hypothetical protein